jgi:predicted acyltransferase
VRSQSVDALRGLAVAGMIVVNNPGDGAHVYPALVHAAWNGLTVADVVFPTFLFLVGVSLALASGPSRSWPRVLRRTVLLVGLGLVVNGFPRYDLATLRYPGVLQRIALTYLAAVVITRHLPRWAQVAAGAVLLGGYWWAMTHVAVPGAGTGVLTPSGNLAGHVDRTVFGTAHIYRGGTAGYDPEGLLSTLPAIVTVLLGCWAGTWVRRGGTGWRTALALLAAALALGAVGAALDPGVPVNKRLWTPSFVAVTAAIAMGALAVLHVAVDRSQRAGAALPLVVMGRNAIVAYVGADLLSGTLQHVHRGDLRVYDWLYIHWFAPTLGAFPGSLAFGLAMTTLWLGVLALMWRARIFLRV